MTVFGLFSLSIAINAYAISLDPFGYSEGSFALGITDIVLASVPLAWLIYLISLHTYLIVAKRSTIELILESRKRAKQNSIAIKPHPEVNKIIKLELPTPHVVFKDVEGILGNNTDP